LAKQLIHLRVTIDPTWPSGTTLQVYSDNGTGTVDFTLPLLRHPQPVYPAEHIARPSYGGFRGRMMQGRPTYGQRMRLGTGRLGSRSLSSSPGYVDMTVRILAGYGLQKIVVNAIDAEGNEQTAPALTTTVFVSSTDVDEVTSFNFNAFDAGLRRATFNIT